MPRKSRWAIPAAALVITAVGGAVVAVRAMPARPETAAPAALPTAAAAPAAAAATARVPASAAGSPAGTRDMGTAASAPASGESGPAAPSGQGQPGPPPAQAIPADGAVPGAPPALRALAATRADGTRLPHSPRLLGALSGPSGWTGAPRTPATGTAATGTATTGTAAATGTAAPTGTATATGPLAPAAAATPSPAALPGIDVASFQHPVTSQYPHGAPITWRSVAAAGYRFAAVKGTEGDYYVNPWAVTDLAGAKAAGLDVTPYHFAIPNVSGGAQQARFAVGYSGYATGAAMLPMMLDIEYDPYVSSDHTNQCYGLTPRQMISWISAFAATVDQLTGQHPVIYSTSGWWNACTGGSTALRADPLWVAAYGAASPPLPAGWPTWTFWQYTSGGTVPGVDTPGATDLSSFNPQLTGLIDPGVQTSHAWVRVAMQIGSLGAAAGDRLSWSASGLPRGLILGPGGRISGTVSGAGSSLLPATYTVTVTARTTSGAAASVTFGWHVTSACARPASGACPAGPGGAG